jgi:uncharacterized protein (DUF362 family)
MPSVVLKKAKSCTQTEISEAVSEALDVLNLNLKESINTVLIKPNLCYYWDYSTGETTDPRVVSAAIDWVRGRLGNDVNIVIAEADASAMRTKYAFKILGYEKLSREKNVELVNLSEGEIVEKEVSVSGEKLALPVNKMVLDADLIVNVPKMKSHRVVGFTCALKNIFGVIAKPKKYVYHSKLHRVIIGINKVVKSDIVLVDGIIVCGKYPKIMGTIVAGDNALATDVVIAKTMGFRQRPEYLDLGAKEGIGDVNNISLIENAKLEEIQKEFPRQNYLLQRLLWQLQLKLLKVYAVITNDVIPPILQEYSPSY